MKLSLLNFNITASQCTTVTVCRSWSLLYEILHDAEGVARDSKILKLFYSHLMANMTDI